MRHLETYYNPEAKKVMKDETKKKNDSKARRDITCLAMHSISDLKKEDEPQTCSDDWDHPNENEFHELNKRKV